MFLLQMSIYDNISDQKVLVSHFIWCYWLQLLTWSLQIAFYISNLTSGESFDRNIYQKMVSPSSKYKVLYLEGV
jgi:hypothetical protein